MGNKACTVGNNVATAEMYYIRNTRAVVGNCALFWADGGHGYTCDLKKAWLVDEEKAREICDNRPEEDFAVSEDEARKASILHVDVQLLPGSKKFRVRSAVGKLGLPSNERGIEQQQ